MFQTCGLYLFGGDFVTYKRIIKISNTKTSNEKCTISASGYVSYLDSKIDPNLFKDFHTTDWEGNKEASVLYDIWLGFKNDQISFTATMSRAVSVSHDTENAIRETNSPSLL